LNSFLPSYHDPVFSILLIVLIAMAIALVTHTWGVYRRERLSKSLYSFLEKFEGNRCSLEEEDVPFEEGMARPLLLLARAFEQSGNYAKTISICLYLIRHTRDDELLIYLGRVYLRAGFLQRAEEIFLEIIARHPRRSDVLYQLEILYESLQEYDKAREALSALEAQGEDIRVPEDHLQFQELKSDKQMTPSRRAEELEKFLEKKPRLYRPIIRELFRLDHVRAWRHVDSERIPSLLDILWYIPPAQLQLDIIADNSVLQAVYYARGDWEKAPESPSGIFAVDMLCAAREGGYRKGTIEFAYLCTECKQSFPVSFIRCPGCMALNSVKVEETLVEEQPQRGDTLF